MTMATNTEASGGEDVRLAAIARGNASPPPAVAVDTAMGCAVSSTLPADAGFTTLELSTNFVRAITQSTSRVFAEDRVVHECGRHECGRVVTTEARVYDDSGILYAHAKSTCLVLRSAR